MKFKMHLKLTEIQAACVLEGLKLIHACWQETELPKSFEKDEIFEACKLIAYKMKDEYERIKATNST